MSCALAFVLMNGPQFVESARVLAERLLADYDGQVDQVLDRAFYLLTTRQPDDEERQIVRRMHAGQLDWYRSHPDDAVKLVAVGDTKPNESLAAIDVAAAAGVINALLNYDGCVVKR